MADHEYTAKVKRLGIPDRIVEHGEQIELHRECGFDPEGIADAAREMVSNKILVY
jgi:1-deoxy-D-xylulose-5-phosphate synthase